MSHKTKAAMQGRQCHYQKLKQSQDTRVNAGGQSLSAPVITGTAPLARFGGISKSGHSRQGYTNLSAHLQTTHKLGCLGCTALAHTPFPQIWGDLDQRAGSTAMQHTPEISRNFDRYPDIGYHCFLVTAERFFYPPEPVKKGIWFRVVFITKFALFYMVFIVIRSKDFIGDWIGIPCFVRSDNEGGEFFFKFFDSLFSGKAILGHYSGSPLADCLLCLRRRRLISPCMAEFINCPVLSPGVFTDSIPSMISCAMRAVTDCDFAFFEPVAMSTFSKVECKTLYTKNYYLEALTCKTLAGYCVSYTLFELRCVNSEARQCANTNRASDHNVIGANNMADLQHTQTRPEFTWRFLSASERYPTAKPLVIYVNASSEQEARDTMPGVNLIFAARLPFHDFRVVEVCHA